MSAEGLQCNQIKGVCMRGARFPFLFLFSVFLTLSGKMAFSTGHSGLSQRLGAVIDSSQQALLRKRASSGAWHYKPNLGSHFTSLNFISSTWFDGPFTWNQNARSALKTHLLNSQLKNGAWCDLRYVNRSCSHLDATLLNYWALKILGMSPMHLSLIHI